MRAAMIAVVLAALCFSTTGTAQAVAVVDASPLSVGAARILLGGGVLGLVAMVTYFWSRRRRSAGVLMFGREDMPRPGGWVIVFIGAVGVLAYQPTFFAGTRINGVAVGTVVALGSAPIVTGILDAMIRRRIPSLRWGIATTIALVGVTLVSGLLNGGTGSSVDPIGLVASMSAGASYAVYAIASKLLLDRSWTIVGAMGSIFGVAAVMSVPVLLMTSPAWILTPAGATLALWLGIVTTAIAYLLFGWGLKRLNPTTVATLTLAEPLAATLLGLIVLHEQLSLVSIIGLTVIATGLIFLSTPFRRRANRVATAA